jgi:hypothetical protein
VANYTREIEYCFAQNFSTVAAATQYTFSTLTITIGESSPTFASVWLVYKIGFNLATSTTSSTAVAFTLKLGAATATSLSAFSDGSYEVYTGGGDVEYWFDVTSYFTTNFGSGPTQTAIATFTHPAAVANACAKLKITYNAATTSTTRTKTVRIPLEGYAGALPTTLTNLGSSTEIPNLSTFCPEQSPTFTDIFFEYSSGLNSTNVTTISVALDSETAVNLSQRPVGSWSGTGNVGKFGFYWKRTDMSTTATHSFKSASSASNAVYNPAVVLVVTYTYTANTSYNVLNSIKIPMYTGAIAGSNLTSTTSNRCYTGTFWVEEPATVTLQQSAVQMMLHYFSDNDNAGDQLQFSSGTRPAVGYNSPLTNAYSAGYGTPIFWLQQRVDANAANGNALSSFARGANSLYSTISTNGTLGSTYNAMYIDGAYLFLNYTSACHASGDHMHNRTVEFLALQETAITNGPWVNDGNSYTPTIAETQWTAQAVWTQLNGSLNYACCNLSYVSSDGLVGWISGAMVPPMVNDWLGPYSHQVWYNQNAWDRYTNDPAAGRVTPFISRKVNVTSYVGVRASVGIGVTYSAISFTFAGTVVGYTGTGAGITVNVHRTDTGEIVQTGTTTSGGAFSITVPDNTIALYGEAYQDGTHLGRTGNYTAS